MFDVEVLIKNLPHDIGIIILGEKEVYINADAIGTADTKEETQCYT